MKRWDAFTRFPDDGQICMTKQRGAQRDCPGQEFPAVRRFGPRRRARGGDVYLIGTAKLDDVDPPAWLADVLGGIAGTPRSRLDELLPWNWVPEQRLDRAA